MLSRVTRSNPNGLRADDPTGDETKTLGFRCLTERAAETDHTLSARGGHRHRQSGQCLLPRWKSGSVVSFTIDKESFPDDSKAHIVGRALDTAVDDWNNRHIGIRFKRAADGEHAVFTVTYEDNNEPWTPHQGTVTYAIAFFPNSGRRVLRIFNTALDARSHDVSDTESREFLANVMRHELGHVLGLRHENAESKEKYDPSVELTPLNKASIMATGFTSGDRVEIQESDVIALKMLYKLKAGSTFRGFKVKVVDPDTLRRQATSKHVSQTTRREASFVGAEAGPAVAHERSTTIAVCFAISICIFACLVVSPRVTVICSS
ncbi:hypothetical protein MFIFM68171_07281 [Madurella fahalii]|uniref:Peptidase metallopeptidase domain-containing protein n=1 Tax=Madurella fahalii TaxID=1157608 RepID=A0ABQ0GH38_9PEZI